MTLITALQTTDNGDVSKGVINTNFANLNTGKAEISGQVFTGAVSAPNLSGTNTGYITITGTKIFELQMNYELANASAFGNNAGRGVNEVYSRVVIDKISA